MSFRGQMFSLDMGSHWKTNDDGLQSTWREQIELTSERNSLVYMRFLR